MIETEQRCERCIVGLLHFTLGLLDGAQPHVCVACKEPTAIYFLPVVPKCPGTDIALTRHADGTLHWNGGTGLDGAPGEEGDDGGP